MLKDNFVILVLVKHVLYVGTLIQLWLLLVLLYSSSTFTASSIKSSFLYEVMWRYCMPCAIGVDLIKKCWDSYMALRTLRTKQRSKNKTYTFWQGDLPKLDLMSIAALTSRPGKHSGKPTSVYFEARLKQWKQVQSAHSMFKRDSNGSWESRPQHRTARQMKDIVATIQRHVEGQVNEFVEGCHFCQRKQQHGESFDDFLVSLPRHAGFVVKNAPKKSIRDQIVEGLLDGDTVEDLLKEPNLTLEATISKCRAQEAAKQQRAESQVSRVATQPSKRYTNHSQHISNNVHQTTPVLGVAPHITKVVDNSAQHSTLPIITVTKLGTLHGSAAADPINKHPPPPTTHQQVPHTSHQQQPTANIVYASPLANQQTHLTSTQQFKSAADALSRNPPSQPREPLLVKPQPTRPFQEIAIDFCTYRGQQFLVIVDCHKDWSEIINMGKNTTTSHLITALLDTFCRSGAPDVIWSDQGPQFMSPSIR